MFPVEMYLSGVCNADNNVQSSRCFCLFHSVLLPAFLPGSDISEMTDGGCACVFKQPTGGKKKLLYFSISFSCIFKEIFHRGFGSCITPLQITLRRLTLFIFSQLSKIWPTWTHLCIYRKIPAFDSLENQGLQWKIFKTCNSQYCNRWRWASKHKCSIVAQY